MTRQLVRAPRSNPAWATQAVAAALPSMQRAFRDQAAMLPELGDIEFERGNRIGATVQEYGCGAYGCVYPTLDPNIVIKVTTDDTEAQFAERYANDLSEPICVHYHAVMPLDEQHGGRNIYILWRESAAHVGDIDGYIDDLRGSSDADAAMLLINAQHAAAATAYKAILVAQQAKQRNGRNNVGAILNRDHAIERWLGAANAMGQVPELALLGYGMNDVYEKQGIFFGDIHSGNVGQVTRNGEKLWVITDPGHVAVIQK